MAFCPKCGFEYRPAVSRCPDCGAWLVAELPPEEAPDRDLGDAVLCAVGGEVEAVLLRSRLGAHGIPSRAQASGAKQFIGGAVTSSSAQPLTASVRREDPDRARAIHRAMMNMMKEGR